MPRGTHTELRREINRITELFERFGDREPSFVAIAAQARDLRDRVEAGWRRVGTARIHASEARMARNAELTVLRKWHGRWRNVVVATVPGFAESRNHVPSRTRTADGTIRIAEYLLDMIDTAAAAAPYRAEAKEALGDRLERASRAVGEALVARREEARARAELRKILDETKGYLSRAKGVVRAALGPTAPEYKALVRRRSGRPKVGSAPAGGDGVEAGMARGDGAGTEVGRVSDVGVAQGVDAAEVASDSALGGVVGDDHRVADGSEWIGEVEDAGWAGEGVADDAAAPAVDAGPGQLGKASESN